MGLELPVLAYLALAAFATAVLHSVGGFAGALLMAIAIAPAIGVKLTVPIVSVAMLVSHGSRAWIFRKAVNWRAFAIIMGVATPFILLGVTFYVGLSEAAVGLFLGTMLLVTIPLRRVLAGKKVTLPLWSLGIVAVPFGFLSGASFGVAMLMGPFLLGAGIVGETLIATVAINGIVLNLIKSVSFGLSPLLTPPLALLGLGLGACTIPGHWVGRWILRHTSIRIHTFLLEGLMTLGALYFLSKAL